MRKAVIFDLDGTLLDSLDDIAGCLNQALAELGLPTQPKTKIQAMVGYGINQLVAQAVPANTPTGPVLTKFRQLYLDSPNLVSRPYPGISELLTNLKQQGIGLAVHTNKLHQLSLKLIGRFFPDCFDYVQGDQVGLPTKPAAEGSLHLLAQLGIPPSAAVFVGDSETDVQTAQNVGMAFIGVTWGFRSAQQLTAAGAKSLCGTAADLQAAILGQLGLAEN